MLLGSYSDAIVRPLIGRAVGLRGCEAKDFLSEGILLKGVTTMPKRILLVQDMTGYGKVALAAIMPVLSHMGHHVFTLPTAIVSNTRCLSIEVEYVALAISSVAEVA